jgi:hypothetical protein
MVAQTLYPPSGVWPTIRYNSVRSVPQGRSSETPRDVWAAACLPIDAGFTTADSACNYTVSIDIV